MNGAQDGLERCRTFRTVEEEDFLRRFDNLWLALFENARNALVSGFAVEVSL